MTGTSRIAATTVVGAGLIGASMAAMFSRAGLPVKVWDPKRDAEAEFHRRLDVASAQLEVLGRHGRGTVDWCSSLDEAVRETDWIQECAPELIPLKHRLYKDIESAAPHAPILASCTSAFTWSDLTPALAHPGRFVTAHPFNPAHLMPLIELYGRDQESVETAVDFYTSMGKQTVRLKRDVVGHIANRLASALWREAVYLVAEGIADVEAVDAALVHGPGLRWSVAGAHLSYHLGGGAGGLKSYLEHLGASQERRWATLGAPRLTPETRAALVAGVEEETAGLTCAELEERRDRLLLKALLLRKEVGTLTGLRASQ